jgi:periplasmic divalent cation tolerance protein
VSLLAVFTTADSRGLAQRIASALVEQGLVACAQIEAIESLYIWSGSLQRQPEYRLLLKTTLESYDAVEALIRSMHSYELPAIYAVPVARASGPYEAWVKTAVANRPR